MTTPYDVIVVGAGPAGSTTAYYLAGGMEGRRGKSVALLEKATFPRDKYCGDAWCAPALDLLEEMGVLQELEAEGLVRDCTSGGFISPSGESYVSLGGEGGAPGTRCYAIKRSICDERIARRSVEVGADLYENAVFAEARLENDGFWTVRCHDGRRFRARMLVAADGAASQVARSLGVVTTAPQGVAGRRYVKGGTHNFKSGGVLFYPTYILPGYVALFRHYNDDIDLGCYVIPGGAAKPEELVAVYENEIENDPFIRRVLGPRVEFLERIRVASLRTGGVERSTARQFMAVGDAAGQTDPLTGEGIHTGMIGGKLAAKTIHELFERNDFSEAACASYHERWMTAFGREFRASAAGARMTQRFPFFLDAAAVVAQRKGDAFMADFGAAMTGVKPKTTFLRPGVALPLGVEILRQVFKQKILRVYPSLAAAYAARGVEDDSRGSAFQKACLIDPSIGAGPRGEESSAGRALDEAFRDAGENPAARRVLLLYGTEYGFAREIAGLACEALSKVQVADEDASLSPRCVSTADHETIDWNETPICLQVCSTAGDGIPPAAAKSFFQFLESTRLDLSAVRYSVLALGDRSYPHFCRAGRTLDVLMRRHGAVPLVPRVEVDKEDMNAVRGWIEAVAQKLADAAAWEALGRDPEKDGLLERARQQFASRSERRVAPTKDDPLLARVAVKRLLTRVVEASDSETLHIELDVSGGGEGGDPPLSWEPGDALGLIPANSPDEVAAVLAESSCTGDELVDLPDGRGRVSLRDALTRCCDIKHVTPELLGALLDASATPEERDRAAAVREASAARYLEERELEDVLREFPAAARTLAAEDFVALQRTFSPRYYSIASAQGSRSDPLCFSVSVVRYERLGRKRTGLATTYLADRVAEGDLVPVFVHPNPDFRLPPADAGRSCVMIGAGCGVAPYRAFLQELTRRARARGESALAQAGGEPHLLFLGCQHEDRDFLYGEEWRAWEAEGSLRLFTAFSRDQEEEIYVQHRMLENGALLWERMAAGSHFYVCGDAKSLAGDVDDTLLEIVRTHSGKSPEVAEAYLEQMRREGRLQQDVWGT